MLTTNKRLFNKFILFKYFVEQKRSFVFVRIGMAFVQQNPFCSTKFVQQKQICYLFACSTNDRICWTNLSTLILDHGFGIEPLALIRNSGSWHMNSASGVHNPQSWLHIMIFKSRVHDSGLWIQDYGYWIQDAASNLNLGSRILNPECRWQDWGSWIPDPGFTILVLDPGSRIQDHDTRILNSESRSWIQHPGSMFLNCGSWIEDPELMVHTV